MKTDNFDPEAVGGYVYLRLWVQDKNKKRLLEMRQIIDEAIGMAEFKEKLLEEGIRL